MDQELKKWNQLATQQDEIYHLCAKRSGLPDAQFWLLYAICETEDALCQNAFCESWCYSKQTASAAVAALEKAGLVSLTYAEGSRKQKELHLTENLLIGSIFRDGKIITPGGSDTIEVCDNVIVVTAHSGLRCLDDIFMQKK